VTFPKAASSTLAYASTPEAAFRQRIVLTSPSRRSRSVREIFGPSKRQTLDRCLSARRTFAEAFARFTRGLRAAGLLIVDAQAANSTGWARRCFAQLLNVPTSSMRAG